MKIKTQMRYSNINGNFIFNYEVDTDHPEINFMTGEMICPTKLDIQNADEN